jgi:thymidylate kinase
MTEVFILVGPSGSGKSTIVQQVKNNVFKINSRYLILNKNNIDNKLLLSKWLYIGSWFNQIVALHIKGTAIVLSDRCPIDTVAYAEDGDLLLDPVLRTFQEIELLGIKVSLIYIRVDMHTLIERIRARILREPERERYHELNFEYLKKTIDFYEKNKLLWNNTVENERDINCAVQEVERIIDGK